MAAVGDVPDQNRQEMAVGARHAARFARGELLDIESQRKSWTRNKSSRSARVACTCCSRSRLLFSRSCLNSPPCSFVRWAEDDDEVRVVVLDGAGRAFCAGYDLVEFGSGRDAHPCQQEAYPYDALTDYAAMKGYTEDFMSLWRCRKPTIAMVHGHAVAGGSDIALCCDLLAMADDARIGYMPTRVWGCPTTAMWTYRLGSRARQAVDVYRRSAGRPPGCRLGSRKPGRPRGRARSRDPEARAAHRGRSAVAPGDAQARRQPGDARHGTRTDPDVRDPLRRRDAAQPRGSVVSASGQVHGFKSAVE